MKPSRTAFWIACFATIIGMIISIGGGGNTVMHVGHGFLAVSLLCRSIESLKDTKDDE